MHESCDSCKHAGDCYVQDMDLEDVVATVGLAFPLARLWSIAKRILPDYYSDADVAHEVVATLASKASRIVGACATVCAYDPRTMPARLAVFACYSCPVYGVRVHGIEPVEFLVFSGAPPARVVVEGTKRGIDRGVLPPPVLKLAEHLDEVAKGLAEA